MIVALPDGEAMARFGRRLALLAQPGEVIALTGPLGAGKTTLARAIIAALGHQGEVPSPTFTLIESYPDTSPPVVHADFYRLGNIAEAAQLGLEDYRAQALLVAEWPERAGGFGHEPGCLAITLEIVGEGRKAIVEPGAAWHGRLP